MQPCWAEDTYFKILQIPIWTLLVNVIVNILIQLGKYCYYCLIFYFILQNKSKITILTFMNVDWAFILAETRRKTSVFIFVDNSMQIYLITNLGRCLSHVSHCHTPLNKISKWWVSVSALWTFNPGAASSCSAVWIHAIRACFRKHNILSFIY